jgi:AcrR family transcriptional regulator
MSGYYGGDMQAGKIDRRVQRTEQALRQALITLILKRGYTDITVQDILDQANMGRSTFYAHFRDKEDLLLCGVETLMAEFEQGYARHTEHQLRPDISGKEISLFFFQHADENRPIFKAMIGKPGGEVVERAAHKYLTLMTEKYLGAHAHNPSRRFPFDLLIQYMVASYLAVLKWWLDQSTPATPQEMNELFWDLVGPGMHTAMGS